MLVKLSSPTFTCAFTPIFLRQYSCVNILAPIKSLTFTASTKKLCAKLSYEKGPRKMLVKLTQGLLKSVVIHLQITMDAPPFEFLEQSGQLRVISLPERFPVISGHKLGHDYRLGDWVNLNCTCFDSYPAATLKWFINGNEVKQGFHTIFLPLSIFTFKIAFIYGEGFFFLITNVVF
jgi:hypothetical protein